MASPLPADIRALVAQVVRDVVADVAAGAPSALESSGPDPRRSPFAHLHPTGPTHAATRTRVETVRIAGSGDLNSFALRLLETFDNPKAREDLRTGRLTFRLAGDVAAPAAPGRVQRIERGAVTERQVAAAAADGSHLVLGPRAVLTPLAREKARSLGVLVEKEER